MRRGEYLPNMKNSSAGKGIRDAGKITNYGAISLCEEVKASKVAIKKECQFILLLTLTLVVFIFLQREIALFLGIPYSLAFILWSRSL